MLLPLQQGVDGGRQFVEALSQLPQFLGRPVAVLAMVLVMMVVVVVTRTG